MNLRAATPADAEPLARAVIDGVEVYRSFAPPGWEPWSVAAETEHTRGLLADPSTCCLLAEDGDAIVGQVTVLPAAVAARPVADPELGHLRNLFVRPDHWGTGLATELHAAAVGAARERGFTGLRLFAAAGQGRARRFYEREGWVAAGPAFLDPVPGLELVEYRLALR